MTPDEEFERAFSKRLMADLDDFLADERTLSEELEKSSILVRNKWKKVDRKYLSKNLLWTYVSTFCALVVLTFSVFIQFRSKDHVLDINPHNYTVQNEQLDISNDYLLEKEKLDSLSISHEKTVVSYSFFEKLTPTPILEYSKQKLTNIQNNDKYDLQILSEPYALVNASFSRFSLNNDASGVNNNQENASDEKEELNELYELLCCYDSVLSLDPVFQSFSLLFSEM